MGATKCKRCDEDCGQYTFGGLIYWGTDEDDSNSRLDFIAGANWHKQQVLEEIEKCNRGDQNMIRLIKVIKEM